MIEITQKIIDSIKDKFKEIESKYVFDFKKFEIASQENKICPPIIPILWQELFETNKILTVDELKQKVKNSSDFYIDCISGFSEDEVLEARCFQFWTGFLREIDFVLKCKLVNENFKIFKDIKSDISDGGIDFIVETCEKRKLYFALMMRNRNSDSNIDSRRARKQRKIAANVIPLFVNFNKNNRLGLAKINLEDIKDCIKYGRSY